jgi:ergothioneine biosynthesis protein EgtB
MTTGGTKVEDQALVRCAGQPSREELVDWFVRTRGRSRELFDLITPEAYYSRPITLRHPIVFYEGHLSAFALNTLVKKGLGGRGVDEELERLFARGIDPEDESAAQRHGIRGWPERTVVRQFVDQADGLILDALAHGDIERAGSPAMRPFEAVHTIIEHEAMHQETLLYIWHRLPYGQKRRPADALSDRGGAPARPDRIRIPSGRTVLGADPHGVVFGWDNEFPEMAVDVPAFAIDRDDVTNAAFMEFVEAGGYREPRWWSAEDFAWIRSEGREHPLFWEHGPAGDYLWRGMFELVPLPSAWPVFVSHAEASAYALWSGGRLPTEAEYHRAAFGTPDGDERSFPWGEGSPDATRGNFDFHSWDPVPVGSYPDGQSAWGVRDLVGNGWEWTQTVFDGFPGFTAMAAYPEYSADFFDGRHYVMKGASPATARELVRRSFRNWFRPHYPYVYATFRCVRSR